MYFFFVDFGSNAIKSPSIHILKLLYDKIYFINSHITFSNIHRKFNVKKSNILVFGSDLIGNEYGDNENAVKIMLNDYTLLQFMDDGDGWDFNMNDFTWGEIYYAAGMLHYSLGNSLDHNIHRKDW